MSKLSSFGVLITWIVPFDFGTVRLFLSLYAMKNLRVKMSSQKVCVLFLDIAKNRRRKNLCRKLYLFQNTRCEMTSKHVFYFICFYTIETCCTSKQVSFHLFKEWLLKCMCINSRT